MKNFMCHSRLDVRLGPHVNFVVGRNGSKLVHLGLCLWCLTSLSTIFQLYHGCRLYVEETGIPGENHRPVTSLTETLSHKVLSSIPRH